MSDLPLPHPSLLALNLKMDLLAQHISTPVAGRTCLFFENWTRVTKDPWVLTTIRGYQIPLKYWPKEHWSTTTVSEERQSVLLEEVTKLREKEAVLPVQQTEAHIVSPVFVVPKHRGGWRLIIDLRYLNSCMVQPHFKMEGLFMLPSMVSQGWLMAKLDLKDAYLTIPIAQESRKLLTFQAGPPHQLMQFRCLPFGLCTAPFASSKATKPITQFLRQLGIHLIVYLDDLLLAAPSREQLLVNLSTAIWLLSNMASRQSGVPNKYPEVHHNSNLSPRVLRICSGYRSDDNISPNTQDQCHYERCNPPSSVRIVASKRFGMSHWDISSNQASGMHWTPTLSCPARLENTNPSAARFLSDIDKPVTRGESRSPVVALRLESQLLGSDCETRSLDSHRVRRFHVRLGSSLPGSNNWWQMDIRGGWFPHQLVGAPSNFSGFAVLFEGQDQCVSFDQIGQSHCYSLPEQDGQPHTIPALPTSSEDLAMVPYISDFSSCRILGGEGQRFGRLGIPSSRQQ